MSTGRVRRLLTPWCSAMGTGASAVGHLTGGRYAGLTYSCVALERGNGCRVHEFVGLHIPPFTRASMLFCKRWYGLAVCGASTLCGDFSLHFTQGVDTGFSCWAGPRVLHGLLLGAQDCAVLVLASTLFGDRAGRYALLAHATSWFVAYCGVRTYSNCVEAFLCTLCLAVWPWGRVYTNVSRARLSVCIALAAVSVVMRPTAALLWAPLFAHYLWYEALWCTKHWPAW